jgi:hypothetical protein
MNIDDCHGDETYQEASPLEDELICLQQQIVDLQWRMNALCGFLSIRYPDDKETLDFAGA